MSVFKAAVTLTIVIATGWAICFWPARMLNADTGVFWMSIAAISCLLPGWIVVFLSGLAIFPNESAAVVVQTLVRLFCVAGTALVVKRVYSDAPFSEFSSWLVGFYLLALFAEVLLLKKATANGAVDSPAQSHEQEAES